MHMYITTVAGISMSIIWILMFTDTFNIHTHTLAIKLTITCASNGRYVSAITRK